jgi:DNA modification methylase
MMHWCRLRAWWKERGDGIDMPEQQEGSSQLSGDGGFQSAASPRAVTPEGFAVYCGYDALVPVESLVENPRNPNTHPESQLKLLGEIIKGNGWRQPITVSKRSGFIVKGHGRYQAAKLIGCSKVPVDYQEYATEAEEWADMVADNRIAELSEMDDKTLADVLKDLSADDSIPLELSGYSDEELTKLLNSLPDDEQKQVSDDEFDIDSALEAEAFVKPGDIWQLGRHRLLCGDSTKEDDVSKLMDGKRANLCITDPPYNCSYKGGTGMTIVNDSWNDSQKFYAFLLDACKNMYSALADGGACYIFHSDAEKVNFYNAAVNAGFHYSTTCIWVKNSLVLGRMDYQMRHEPVLYCFKDTGKHKFYGDRTQTTVWEFDKPRQSKLHPTMKPLDLIAYPMRMSSQENGIVIDLFGGSGSTLIAAEQLDRICYTMELDPKYASAIVRRYIALRQATDDVVCIRDGKEIPCLELYQPTEADLSYQDTSVTGDD